MNQVASWFLSQQLLTILQPSEFPRLAHKNLLVLKNMKNTYQALLGWLFACRQLSSWNCAIILCSPGWRIRSHRFSSGPSYVAIHALYLAIAGKKNFISIPDNILSLGSIHVDTFLDKCMLPSKFDQPMLCCSFTQWFLWMDVKVGKYGGFQGMLQSTRSDLSSRLCS